MENSDKVFEKIKKIAEKNDQQIVDGVKKTPHEQLSLYCLILFEIKNAMLNTTAHGLPQIVRNENIALKLIWTIMFLGSASYCCYLVVKTIASYLVRFFK
jgi:hypothetical protein